MKRITLPLTGLVLPLSLSGFFVSNCSPVWANHGNSEQLTRMADRLVRIQHRHENLQATRAPRLESSQKAHMVGHPSNNLKLNQQTIFLNVSKPDFHNRSQFIADSGQLRNMSKGADLDLTSDGRSIKLGNNLFQDGQSVSITVGGEQKSFSTGAFVTPAEYIAISQKLESGSQDLVLGSKGDAIDGQILLNLISDAGRRISATSLVVPQSVDAVGNFAGHGDFKLTGVLDNFGAVYALSNKADVSSAKISARAIHNFEGATISSEAPASLSQQFGPLNSAVSLDLDASDEFVNFGKVSSSSDLNISSGHIVNAGGVMSAKANINLNSSNISNYGSIASQNANVNINTATAASIDVNNTGGSIEALNGAINVRTVGFSEKVDTALIGGDWLSRELNVQAGEGLLSIDAGIISGAVTARAGIAHISADTPDLYVKDLIASGDPVITNTGSLFQGSIATSGGPLTLVAGGDIVVSASALLDTTNGAGAGGDVLLVAGATFEDPGGIHPGQVWITGASALGGNILGNGAGIDSSGTTNAGNITLVAFPGQSFVNGDITYGSIFAKGGTGGNNGNVLVIGRSTNFAVIDTNGAGSTAATGNVTINSFNPQISGTEVRIDSTTGAVVSGSFIPLPTITTDPDPSDSVVADVNAGGTLLMQSPDDVIVNGDIVANKIIFEGRESIEMQLGSSIISKTDVSMTAFGLSDSSKTTVDTSIIRDVNSLNGNINIIQQIGSLNIAPGALILAIEGNILIHSQGVNAKTSKKSTYLILGDGAHIEADASTGSGLGNVVLATGTIPVPVIEGKPYKNVAFVETDGGNILWGKKKPFLSKLDNIQLLAKGANITFSNGISKKHFSIGANVQIVGDPPSAVTLDSTAAQADSDSSNFDFLPVLRTSPESLPEASPVVATSAALNSSPQSVSDSSQFANVLDSLSKFSTTSMSNLSKNINLNSTGSLDYNSDPETKVRSSFIDAFVWSDVELGINSRGDVIPARSIDSNHDGLSSAETAKMRSGNLLFASQKDAAIETSAGTIEIAAGTVVLIVADHQTVAVYDLHDDKKSAVKMTLPNKKTIQLSPGYCAVVTKSNGQFSDVNPLEAVGYRAIDEQQLSDGMKLFRSEFSTLQAAAAIRPLAEILRSQHQEARKVAAKFIKTSAVLMQLGNKHFELHPKRSLTAWQR